jgi:hypothetical protein
MFDTRGVLAEVQQLDQDAAKLAAAPLWPLTDQEITDCLKAAHLLQQKALGLQARLVQQAQTRGLAAQQGHRSTAGWLRAQLLLDPGPARDLAACATALSEHPSLEQALLGGQLDARQAAAIAATATEVTAGLADMEQISPAAADEIAGRATATMIAMAGRLSAAQLRRVGERILAHVAPHLAELADEQALARQEARARRARGFTLSAPVDGLVRLSGVLGLEDAATVNAALQPLCAPTPDDTRSAPQRRADALIEVCRLALRTGELPETGGEPSQLSATVGYDPLTRALGIATTDNGERLSAETARRLACDARILPVILGGTGQILDVGRSRRLATGSLRRALAIRDRGCAFPDCDRPPRWTDAHHITSWTAGGTTALDNLVLLCRRHHRLIHDPTEHWQIRLGADRHPDFIPPPHIDPSRHPRRNLYHLRQ